MGAARRAEAEEDGVRNTRNQTCPKPATRVLPDAQVPKPETPAPSFDRHAASSATTQSIDPQHAMRLAPTPKRIGPIRRRHPITRRRVPGEHPPRSPKRTQRSKPPTATRRERHPSCSRRPAIRPRPSSRCRERNTPRRPTTTRILNQFAIRRWRASRCSARRRLSLCRSAKPPFQTHSK